MWNTVGSKSGWGVGVFICSSEDRQALEMSESESTRSTRVEGDQSVRQVCANGVCMKTNVVEEKLDEGNIQEAESALRDGLSLNFEVGFVKTYEFNYVGEAMFL